MTPSMLDMVLSFVAAVAVGTLVVHFGLKALSGIHLTLAASLRASFVAQVVASIVGLIVGFALASVSVLAFIVGAGLTVFVQGTVFRVAARAAAQTLAAPRAYVLAFINVLSSFLISSPLVAWVLHSLS